METTQNTGNFWNSISEMYQKRIEKQFELTKKLSNSWIENYQKQMEFSLESNKKIREEFNKQMDQAFKFNQKLWSDLLSTSQNTTASENISSDGAFNGSKKQTKVTPQY